MEGHVGLLAVFYITFSGLIAHSEQIQLLKMWSRYRLWLSCGPGCREWALWKLWKLHVPAHQRYHKLKWESTRKIMWLSKFMTFTSSYRWNDAEINVWKIIRATAKEHSDESKRKCKKEKESVRERIENKCDTSVTVTFATVVRHFIA